MEETATCITYLGETKGHEGQKDDNSEERVRRSHHTPSGSIWDKDITKNEKTLNFHRKGILNFGAQNPGTVVGSQTK